MHRRRDVGGTQQGAGAYDNLRQLAGDRGDRRRGGAGAQRDLDDGQPALEQGAGERNRIPLPFDRQNRDDGDAAEQGVHNGILLPGRHWGILVRQSVGAASRSSPSRNGRECWPVPSSLGSSRSRYRLAPENRFVNHPRRAPSPSTDPTGG